MTQRDVSPTSHVNVQTSTQAATHTAPPLATTPMPVVTRNPSPTGWHDYDVSGLHVALPAKWSAVNVSKEGLTAIMAMVKKIDSVWAEGPGSSFNTEEMQDKLNSGRWMWNELAPAIQP
jgi:hypothetical protein